MSCGVNNTIDLAFHTAKVETLKKDEKAKMIVEGASLAYNIAQVARFRSMIVELLQICNYIVYKARITGGCTQGEYDLALECQRQIEECNQQIAKHGTMTVVDGISLLMDMFGNLNKK